MTTHSTPAHRTRHQIVRATGADTGVLAQVIAEAFFSLPVCQWLIPDQAARRAAFPGYFGLYVEHALTDGLAHTTPDRAAVALWLPGTGPGAPPAGYTERLAALTGPHLATFQTFDQVLDRHHPAGVFHHHLAILAVRPDGQGQGIGTALLYAHHATLDQDGTPAYLEASSRAQPRPVPAARLHRPRAAHPPARRRPAADVADVAPGDAATTGSAVTSPRAATAHPFPGGLTASPSPGVSAIVAVRARRGCRASPALLGESSPRPRPRGENPLTPVLAPRPGPAPGPRPPAHPGDPPPRPPARPPRRQRRDAGWPRGHPARPPPSPTLESDPARDQYRPGSPAVCAAAPPPAPAPGLPPRQGTVLAVLWEAPRPLTAAQISARLPTPGISHALGQLRAAGLITATQSGRLCRYQPALPRDAYLAALVTAALDQAADSAAVLRAALHTHRAGNPHAPARPAPCSPAAWPRGPAPPAPAGGVPAP